jgi:hypothetical protein
MSIFAWKEKHGSQHVKVVIFRMNETFISQFSYKRNAVLHISSISVKSSKACIEVKLGP